MAKLGATNEVSTSSYPSVPAARRMGLFADYLCHSAYVKGKLASYCMRLVSHWAVSLMEGAMQLEALTWSTLLFLLSPNQLQYKE